MLKASLRKSLSFARSFRSESLARAKFIRLSLFNCRGDQSCDDANCECPHDARFHEFGWLAFGNAAGDPSVRKR